MHWSVLRMARKVVCLDDDEFLFQDAFVQAAASAAARNPYVGERQTRPKDARRLRYLMSRPSWTSDRSKILCDLGTLLLVHF